MIRRYKNRILLAIVLYCLFRIGMYGYSYFKPIELATPGTAKTSISAEDIERILELNGASVRVTVTTDTSYVSVSVPEVIGVSLPFLKKQNLNHLVEQRTWLIKAGVQDFKVRETEKGFVLQLKQPVVSVREHVTEEYTVKQHEGVWNPVTLTKLELRSRDIATAKAVKMGLLNEARFSIENALYEFLPNNVELKWN